MNSSKQMKRTSRTRVSVDRTVLRAIRAAGRIGNPFDEGDDEAAAAWGGVMSVQPVLISLLDGPGHGYEVIRRLEEKTEGRWRPSPGSVYPLLQLLEGKRVYELTESGCSEAEELLASRGLPWEEMGRGGSHGQFRGAVRELHLAAKQVGLTGSPAALTRP